MTEEKLILRKFRSIIEFISIPASIVDLEKRRILASNPVMIHDFGVIFAESNCIEVELPLLDKGPNGNELFFSLCQSNANPVLCPCQEVSADFELVIISPRLALLFACKYQRGNSGDDSAKPIMASDSSSMDSPFHFSYIFNFTTGSWTFSNPTVLYDNNLLAQEQPAPKLIWRDIIVPEDVSLYDNIISTAIKHGGNHQFKYRIKRLDGRIVQVDDYCGMTQQDDKWPVLVGTIISKEQSFSQIREVERQVLAGKLIGGMVHDFKNLLSGIQNILEWCKLKVDNPDVCKSLGKTIDYTGQATSLIQNVLSVSSGKKSKKTEKIYLNSIINDLKGLLTCIIPSTIHLQLDVATDLPPIYGQSSLLKDMILNLCVNARDAMKQRGDCLLIRVDHETQIDSRGQNQIFIKLLIQDNGCGMTEAEVKNIFNAFYSTKETGTGLGLWMVNEAIRSFDGDVNVTSKLDKGTIFEIWFPVIEKSIDIKHDNSVVSVDNTIPHESFVFQKNKTVLFIEDEPLIRSGVSSWLDSWGINLLVADDGQKALEIFNENQDNIDAIIQDFILPGKRGDELLEIFTKTMPDIPVIVTSGNPDKDAMNELKSKGAYAFIEKPFKMERLFSVLYDVLEK